MHTKLHALVGRLYSYLIVLTSVPTPCDIQQRTSSPSLSQMGGVRPDPIPGGVPVMMMVPAGNVEPWDRYDTTLMVSRCRIQEAGPDLPRDLKDHLIRRAILQLLSIDVRLQVERVRVGHGPRRHEGGSERAEAVKA